MQPMANWYEKAQQELDERLASGDLTDEQYRLEARELDRDLRAEAEEAAERAYDDTMGGW